MVTGGLGRPDDRRVRPHEGFGHAGDRGHGGLAVALVEEGTADEGDDHEQGRQGNEDTLRHWTFSG